MPEKWLHTSVEEWVRETAWTKRDSANGGEEEVNVISPDVIVAIVLQGAEGMTWHPREEKLFSRIDQGKARYWIWINSELGDWLLYEKLRTAAKDVHPFVLTTAMAKEGCKKVLMDIEAWLAELSLNMLRAAFTKEEEEKKKSAEGDMRQKRDGKR